MKELVKIEFTLDEANMILAALGQQPYVKVADLIHKIQHQGTEQLQPVSEGKLKENQKNTVSAKSDGK